MKRQTSALFLAFGGLAVGTAHAHDGSAARVVTTTAGTFLVPSAGDTARPWAYGPIPEAVLWTHTEAVAIPESVSLAQSSASGWVGETLNQERLQRFAIPGTGVPAAEFPMGFDSPTRVSAAAGADLVVILDKAGGPFTLRAYNSTSPTELWHHEFPATFTGADAKAVKVSRDGSTVAAYLIDGTAQTSTMFFFDGAGTPRTPWTFAGWGGAVDLTDDGSLALATQLFTGRVIDTATATEIFSADAFGAGGRFNISGDGSILVLGGFDLRVLKRQGSVWVPVITYNAPTSWFGWGSAVSRDGSTVGVMSHDYGAAYLNTATRIFDVPSGTLLGTYPTTGAGGFQDSIAGAAMSDDGSVLAVCSWGTQNNAHPEVLIFDRGVNLIGSVDTPGSPFGIDMTGNGRYVLVGSKAVHANTFGNGGRVTLFENPPQCYPDCTGEGNLTIADFICFQAAFVAGDPYADCNQSGTLTIADFVCFQGEFVGGCP